jgi:hypothetical protein
MGDPKDKGMTVTKAEASKVILYQHLPKANKLI